MSSSPFIYLAFIALCALVREITRSYFRHRDMALLLKTQDPSNLRYLVQLEQARRPLPLAQRGGKTTPARPEDAPERCE